MREAISVENQQKSEVIERFGNLYIDEQKYDNAINIYALLFKTNPSVYSKFKLAIAYGLDGNYKQSINYLE